MVLINLINVRVGRRDLKAMRFDIKMRGGKYSVEAVENAVSLMHFRHVGCVVTPV